MPEQLQITKALRVRVYPTPEQAERINATIDCCRFVYNYMLERNNKVYARRGEHLNYNAMQNLLPGMKRHLLWLGKADSQALKYACRQVDQAFSDLSVTITEVVETRSAAKCWKQINL